MKRYRVFLLWALLFSLQALAFAQQTQPQTDASLLTLERIFNSDDLGVKGIGGFRWLKSGDGYSKLENSTTVQGGRDLVAYDAATQQRTVLLAAEKLIPKGDTKPLPINSYEWSADNQQMLIYTNSKKVWRLNTRGDYWVLNLETGALKKLGGTAAPSTLMFAKFSPDGTRVGYVRENNIYVENIADGKITQITTDGGKNLINGTSDWVNEEEFFLRDCWRWSPDGKSIAYWQFNTEGSKDYVLVDNTKELYPVLNFFPYPKAGTTNAAVRAGVVSADGGKTVWMNTPGDLRQNYIVMLEWMDNSNEVIMQHMNRLQNTDTVLIGDAKTGAVRTILTEKDDAWIELTMPRLRWIDGGKRFLWMSERGGWQQVYSVARDGSDVKLITPGDYDVESLSAVDEASGWLYFIASPTNATQRYLFRKKLDGTGQLEKITPDSQPGWHNYNLSPNARWAIHNYSSFGNAPKFEMVNITTKTARVMEDNAGLQAKLDKLKKGPSEFFQIDIGEGVKLDGWIMKPPGFDPNKKYPVLFYVYGEPAGQTVVDLWDGGNYPWHLMLTQQGYIVASVDNRGTPAPKGRAWRKSIYRKNGRVNSADQANAVKAMLAKMPYLDASRVGIWGWSGGGVSTLNAMFRYPDIYKMGMAVAPVPDQRFYDTIYTERYMGLPQDNNGEDYKLSSPITFADGLKGDLLIVHGTGDDNVHYQGTEVLINKLIELNKPFQMMAYPNRTHGIFEGEGTTLHLYSLLTRYLKEHLPADAK
jgi:dipeptidyl-peptidase 4